VHGREEGGVAGVEGVVDVRGDCAVEGHEVDGVKGGAQGDVEDGEEAGLGVKVKVAARVVLTVHSAVEGPHGVVRLAGLGRRPDVHGLGGAVALEVGAEEVLGVEGEGEDDGIGDDGADGALGCDGGSGDGGLLVPIAVAGDAEAGALRRLAVAAVGIVRDAPEVVEDLLVVRDAVGGQGGLAVDGVKDGELGGLGGVPSRVRRGGGVGRRGEEDAGVGEELGGGGRDRCVRADRAGGGGDGLGGRGGRWRRAAGDVGLGPPMEWRALMNASFSTSVPRSVMTVSGQPQMESQVRYRRANVWEPCIDGTRRPCPKSV